MKKLLYFVEFSNFAYGLSADVCPRRYILHYNNGIELHSMKE